MDAELNSKGMIINSKNFIKSHLTKLIFFGFASKPTLKNTSITQILDSLDGNLSLLLHGLIIVRGDKLPLAPNRRVEEVALNHDIE